MQKPHHLQPPARKSLTFVPPLESGINTTHPNIPQLKRKHDWTRWIQVWSTVPIWHNQSLYSVNVHPALPACAEIPWNRLKSRDKSHGNQTLSKTEWKKLGCNVLDHIVLQRVSTCFNQVAWSYLVAWHPWRQCPHLTWQSHRPWRILGLGRIRGLSTLLPWSNSRLNGKRKNIWKNMRKLYNYIL